jgi:hypothetical protein
MKDPVLSYTWETSGPLGLRLRQDDDAHYTTIVRVQEPALEATFQALGIEAGMAVETVAGEDVSMLRDLDSVIKVIEIKAAVRPLTITFCSLKKLNYNAAAKATRFEIDFSRDMRPFRPSM